MEFWIAFGVTFIIGSIYSLGKRANRKELGHKHATDNEPKDTTVHQHKQQQADEELITIILPTINNDK